MAFEPDLALFRIASGSLPRRQILADFHQSIAKQRIPLEWSSKVTTDVIFSSHIARSIKLVSN